MTATTMYRVTGHCAHATINSSSGRVRQLHFKGQLLPPDTPAAEIHHLLSVKLIEPILVGAAAPPPVQPEPADAGSATGDGASSDQGADSDTDGGSGGAAPGEQPLNADQTPPAEGADVEAQRADARAKLEAAGGKPTGRHGQPVWVEYLVTKGYDYNAVAKADKKELVEIANSLDQ